MKVDGKPLERRTFDSPVDLLVPERFDVVAKCIYARWKDKKQHSDWGRTVYANHILAINGGVESRSDPLKLAEDYPKISMDDFYASYDTVLESIKHRGFNSTGKTLPVSRDGVLLDGAHRAAACIYYQKQPIADIYAVTKPFSYSYDYFDKRGLDADVLDFMAVEYVLLRPDCYVLLVWPSAEKNMPEIRQMAAKAAQVVCEKKIKITTKQMPINIVQQVYSDEQWLLDKYGSKNGGRRKAARCFVDGKAAYIMLLCASSNQAVSRLKDDIRKLVSIGNHSAHTTEGKTETVRLARLFFNRNSLHHLAYARPYQSAGFWERLSAYKQALPADADNFCIHGSTVMEAYGIREARDCDYVSLNCMELPGLDISLANEKPELANMSIGEAIDDPRNYFYYHGLKFATLQAVMQLKQNRGEKKDRRDVRMTKSQVLGGFSFDAAATLWHRYVLWHKQRKMRRKIKRQLRLQKINEDLCKKAVK